MGQASARAASSERLTAGRRRTAGEIFGGNPTAPSMASPLPVPPYFRLKSTRPTNAARRFFYWFA